MNIRLLTDGQGGTQLDPIMLVAKLPHEHLVTPPKEHYELLPIWLEGT